MCRSHNQTVSELRTQNSRHWVKPTSTASQLVTKDKLENLTSPCENESIPVVNESPCTEVLRGLNLGSKDRAVNGIIFNNK